MLTLDHQYSNNITGKKIAILGPLPPPLGGVSVHCARVIAALKKQNNVVHHFNTTVEYRYRFLPAYLAVLILFLLRFRPEIIYYHTSYLSNAHHELRLLAFLKKYMGFLLVLVEHDCRYLYVQTAEFKKRFNVIVRSVDQQIFIGTSTFNSFQGNGIAIPAHHSIESAFLPPDQENEHALIQSYPESVHAFLRVHRPLIVANAFQYSLLNGKDLYGFALSIDLVESLAHIFPNLGLLFVVAQIGNTDYFEQCSHMIKNKGLERTIFILTGHYELWPLLKHADLFVRPTLSDGASVSVSEALYFNVPVVASDACARPEGTVLFKTGNTQDFIYKALQLLQKKEVDGKAYCKRNNMYSKSIT